MKLVNQRLTLTFVVCISLLQIHCNNDARSQEQEEEQRAPSVPVETADVARGDISAFFSGTASLEAEQEAMVVAKTGGIVEQIFVEEGNYVKRGAALAKLDDERLVLELQRAQAALARLEGEHTRKKGMYEKQLISTEEYEQINADYETQKSVVDLAKLSVEHSTVRAPIAGVISERLIKVGNMVQTNEATYKITDFTPLLAVMHVPERELNKLSRGQTAQLTVDAIPATTFTGRIKRISPVVDPMTGTFKVTVEVRDRSRRLKPGMFGRVRIVFDTHENTLLVPKQAIVSEDDELAIYQVVDDTLAIRRVVETGYSDESHTELLDEEMADQVVIVTGQNNLRDSSTVEIID